MKKLLSLGGNHFQLSAVLAAKRLGCYVIGVDYLPDNPAHAIEDEYHNISTLDRDAVLALAKERQIDGIISYASDVSAPTAAYVANALGLPGNPLKTVEIMTDKSRFHPFLREHGFFVPKIGQVKSEAELTDFLKWVGQTVIVKPAFGSGSKGISRVESEADVHRAFTYGMEFSYTDSLVVEEYVSRVGYQVSGDLFCMDGQVVFFGLGNGHFDDECNPLVPCGASFPGLIDSETRSAVEKEFSRVISALGFRTGAVNVEGILTERGELFIVEMGPRNGGNCISEALTLASGFDVIELTVQCAVGLPCEPPPVVRPFKCAAEYAIHTRQDSIFRKMTLQDELKKNVVETKLFCEPNQKVRRFATGRDSIGSFILSFSGPAEMQSVLSRMQDLYSID